MYKLPLTKFPDHWGFKRVPRRSKDLWVFNFEQNYDWDNLWYDAIQINETTIILIGPPLYETSQFLKERCYFSNWTNRPLKFEIYEMDRVCITVITVDKWISSITLVDGSHRHNILVERPSTEFQGKKTIVTISKNHPIPWLQQWIDYHKVVHNLDGLLIYNNQSTIYDSKELQETIQRPDMHIRVVDYNVPFGCMGGGDWEWEGKKGTSLPWDSDFSQYVMLEHAKWKFLYCSKLVINADTDELLILRKNSLDEIANFCQTAETSVWLYKGIWIEPIDSISGIEAYDIPFENRRFSNYWHTADSNQRGIGIKWMLNPQKNINYQWHLHKTTGPHAMTDDISFGHYLGMNTSWSWQRDKLLSDKKSLRELLEMKQSLDLWKKI